ncbi:MAG: hypothetical protein Q8M98_09305 [Candidatus Cloacimonadaceae bacterium]|nr:hypothetical protein [Candidatus Cloacimonadaceae bacterium]MDP3114961.1 hypothetical protein [Candidatus Cloacimonadaceae bacterium]
MRLSKRHLSLLLVLLFIAVISVVIAQKQKLAEENVVEDFKIEDIPADDGTGLMLSWKPLHRSKRILEYRVYRGISPDTLFFLASIPVNVKTGVASNQMFFYDSGNSDFIDIGSPGKLRREKGQNDKSPLFRKIPRNMEIAARLSEKFDIFSSLEKKAYYYRSDKVRSANAEDSTYYAGMKFRQLVTYAYLRPGETYYYTVVAVNERNQYMPHAIPQASTPLTNPPEPATAFYSAWLEDKQELRFEWELPLFKQDITSYRIHIVRGISDSLWMKVKDDPAQQKAYATPIAQGGIGGGALKNYTAVGAASLASTGIDIDAIKGAGYAIELLDGESSSMSHMVQTRQTNSSAIPPKPTFHAEDKPNDKGDRLSVIWDNAIVFITKTSSLDQENTKLKINYQLNKAETQKVQNIYFSLYRTGEEKPFVTINEYHQDNIIRLDVPTGYDYKQGFKMRITMQGKPKIPADYYIEQNLEWDETMLALMPSKQLYRTGVEVSGIKNVVYRRGIRSPQYTLIKSNTSYDNNLDVTISYPSTVGRMVYGINFVKGDMLHTYTDGKRFSRKLLLGEKHRGNILVSPELDFTYDREAEMTLMTNLFKDEAIKAIDGMKTKLVEMKSQMDTLKAMPMTPEVEAQITGMKNKLETMQKRVNAYENNEHMQKALSRNSDRSRIRYVASIREPESRHQSYMLVKTDGRGLYVESDPDTLANGEVNFMIPVSNWFDRNKIVTLIATLLFGLAVVIFVNLAKRGKDLFIRSIAGLQEIDNAIGRATEMGRPMLYCMGNGGLSDVATLASLGILGLVAKKAAEYDTRIIVPCYDFIVMPIAQEIVREAHYSVGRPDSYDKNSVFYLSNAQFAYVAGVNGIMVRERMATNFFMGFFAAEALLMTETGNMVGAVQIAGSDAITQIPFFITTCDYTLIGEELYAASAYLNREPMLLGTLKAQDYFKFLILSCVIVGAILATFQVTQFMQLFPLK